MCGRYSLTTPPEALQDLFGVSGAIPNFPASYNVAPTHDVPVVRMGARGRELTLLRWGLIPAWAKPGAKPLINARGESVAEKPSFRTAFARRRCLLPADGFYEWRRPEHGPKQPYNVHLKAGGPFAMAAIWEAWSAPDGGALETCAIVTTAANETLARVHHRMPVILAPGDWQAWLETPEEGARGLLELLRPAPNDLMEAYGISTRVNRVANNGPELIKPLVEAPDPAPHPAEEDGGQGSLF